MVVRPEYCEHLLQHRLVLDDQASLESPVRKPTEGIESRAAEPPQAGQQPKQRQHPRTEFTLADLAGPRIGARDQRRREVKAQPVRAVKRARELLAKCRRAVQPG